MPYPSTVDSGTSNASVGTDGQAIPTSSTLVGGSDGTNLQQLLVESATNRNLRTALYNAANELAIDGSGRLTEVSAASILAGIGAIGDAAWSLSGNASEISILKKLALLLQSVAYDSTDKLKASLYGKNSAAGDTAVLVDGSGRQIAKILDSGGDELAIDSGGRITAILQAVAGTALAADVSNTEIRVSSYGKGAGTAGDTALLLDSSGRAQANIAQINSVTPLMGNGATGTGSPRVTLASDSSQPINTGTPTETVVSIGTSSTDVLSSNANRKLLGLINDSSNIVYVATDGGSAALNDGIRLNANGGSILFDRYVPTAAVKAIATGASSNLLVITG